MPDEKRQERVHLIVSGRVQGVGFRYYTYDEAVRIGVVGCVRNLYDGGVEVIAEGTRPQLDALIASVRQGPAFARVVEVRESWESAKGQFREFRITH
ncbi:MAG: acylphosphatase [bacterium]